MALSDRWFKEDRAKYKGAELRAQKEASTKAILAATLVHRRLRAMLEEDIEKTYLEEEDYQSEAWERKVLAAAAKRQALKQVLKLLPQVKD